MCGMQQVLAGQVMSASKPRWVRLDACAFDHPKVVHAVRLGGHESITLWIRGIAWSGQHLTDGWVAPEMPGRWGYRVKHAQALVDAGLWHEPLIEDYVGWLIHDYGEYQPTRQQWEKVSEQRKLAAQRRWEK